MTAVRLSSPDLVNLLIDAGADLVRVEYAARYARLPSVLLPFIDNGDKDRALVEAIAAGRLENVQILLERGAVPTARGLLIACAYNHASIVRELLGHGVVPDDIAMQTTIYWNAVDAMGELIRWGLKPIDADVHYATMHNRPRGLSFLLEHKANVECEMNGTLPIHVSARHGLVDCINLLIEGGARWNASDNLGCTPMHWSAIRKNPAAMNALLTRGAYVNVEEGGDFLPTVRSPTPDWSPIHVSVEGRGFDVVGILLNNKAKQIPMWDGRWPLHIAVQNARVDLVPVLLKYGASLAVKNLKGLTPIELAQSMERDDITEILAKGPD